MDPSNTLGKPLEDDEANAIASTMPKLKHLEMAYHLISTTGVLQILSNCPTLEFLELRLCWGVDNLLVKWSFPKLKVVGPDLDWEVGVLICENARYEAEFLKWLSATNLLRDLDCIKAMSSNVVFYHSLKARIRDFLIVRTNHSSNRTNNTLVIATSVAL